MEGAGTYTGNVYEVKGVSPEFMLCMVWENGWVETFINHNDITLYKGADLVDDWLDLRGNYDAIAFETIIDHQFAYETLDLSEEELEVFDQFLDTFAEADYVYVEEIVEHPFGGDWDTADMMDFYYVKEKGDYDFAPFQYGGFVRFGFGGLGIYGKYYANDIFANMPNETSLNNFTFGLSFGF